MGYNVGQKLIRAPLVEGICTEVPDRHAFATSKKTIGKYITRQRLGKKAVTNRPRWSR